MAALYMSIYLGQMFRTSCFAFFHNVILEISAAWSNYLSFKKNIALPNKL